MEFAGSTAKSRSRCHLTGSEAVVRDRQLVAGTVNSQPCRSA